VKTQEKMGRESRKDLQVLEVRRWRELVADRKKLKDIFRQAKAHSGCSANGRGRGGGRRRSDCQIKMKNF